MKFFFTLCSFFPLLLSAQCYGSFEAFVAGGISQVTGNNGGFSSNEHWRDVPVFAEHFGFGASFVVGHHTLLRTSMQFARYGDRAILNGDGLRWGTQHDGLGGFDPNIVAEPSFSGEQRFTSRLLYLEGVVALRYQLPSRSYWQPFLEGGLAFGSYTTTVTKHNKDAARSQSSPTIRQFAPVARGGAGLDCAFNDRVGIYGMMVMQYHLLSVSKTEEFRVHPWRLALEVGIRVFMDPR